MKIGFILGIVAAVLILTVGAIVVSAEIGNNAVEEEGTTSCGCGLGSCSGQCGGGCSANTCSCKG